MVLRRSILLTDHHINLTIPYDELLFRFSRSSGPGGQHANRTDSRVELVFNVRCSTSLTEEQRLQICQMLGQHLDRNGALHLTSQRSRSQWQNRQEVVSRLQSILNCALRPLKERRPTYPPRAAYERRLADKRRRHGVKRNRQVSEADFE